MTELSTFQQVDMALNDPGFEFPDLTPQESATFLQNLKWRRAVAEEISWLLTHEDFVSESEALMDAYGVSRYHDLFSILVGTAFLALEKNDRIEDSFN